MDLPQDVNSIDLNTFMYESIITQDEANWVSYLFNPNSSYLSYHSTKTGNC